MSLAQMMGAILMAMAKFALLFHYATLLYSGFIVLVVGYDELEDLFTGRNVDAWVLMAIWMFIGSLLVTSFLSNGVFKPRPPKNGGGLFSLFKLTIKRRIKEEKKRLESLDS